MGLRIDHLCSAIFLWLCVGLGVGLLGTFDLIPEENLYILYNGNEHLIIASCKGAIDKLYSVFVCILLPPVAHGVTMVGGGVSTRIHCSNLPRLFPSDPLVSWEIKWLCPCFLITVISGT